MSERHWSSYGPEERLSKRGRWKVYPQAVIVNCECGQIVRLNLAERQYACMNCDQEYLLCLMVKERKAK